MLRGVLWNLGLAVIPVALGYLLAGLLRRAGRSRLVALACAPLALAWLAFLPNTCYLLTEWRHLLFDPRWEGLLDRGHADRDAMLRTARWALFFLAYSGLGVLLFTLAVRPVEHWLRERGRRPYVYAPFFFALVSLGVYLGLIERLNSWDLFHRPAVVLAAAQGAFTSQPLMISIGLFALLLWGLYEAVDIWVDGVAARLPRGQRGGGQRGGGQRGGRARRG